MFILSLVNIGAKSANGLGKVKLGDQLYKIGKVTVLYRTGATTQTQPQHTTTNMSRRCPLSSGSGFTRSLSMGRAKLPANNCATAPPQVCAGGEPLGSRSPASFDWFGASNCHPSKKRGGGFSALGGCRLAKKTQQSIDSLRRRWMVHRSGDVAGAEHTGGCCWPRFGSQID